LSQRETVSAQSLRPAPLATLLAPRAPVDKNDVMKLAIHGYGKMGRNIERIATERGHEVVAVFDVDEPITAEALAGVAVVVDFSHASAIDGVVDACCQAGVNLVTGTTGWDDRFEEVVSRVREGGIGMVHAANFSPGATILFALARRAGQLAAAAGGFAAGIEERHHAQKKDAPSGTALRLARETRSGSGGALDVPIAASRVGHEFGLHTLFFDSPDDLVELSHRARGRDGFARGAILAAEKLEGKTGTFTFEELIFGPGPS
jgi:4-hydroxy-tetrahydrodipicolinate reductase